MKFIIAAIVISGAAIGALIKELGEYAEEINPFNGEMDKEG